MFLNILLDVYKQNFVCLKSQHISAELSSIKIIHTFVFVVTCSFFIFYV